MNTNIISLLFSGIADFIKGSHGLLNNPRDGANSPNSHTNKSTGKPKIPYSKIAANNEAVDRTLQTGEVYSPYKCRECDDYHIGHGNSKGPALVLIFSSLAMLIPALMRLFGKKE